MNRVFAASQQAAVNAALRSGKSGLRLLDDADQNIGNGTTLMPVSLLAPGVNYTTIPNATNPRVLNLTAHSRTGQSITVVLTAARLAGYKGVAGPITGIIEFGNGSQTTTIEFDVPIGPFMGNAVIALPASQPQDSGAVVQVPAGVLRVFFRYDNALVVPNMFGTVFKPAPPADPTLVGPFAPNVNNSYYGPPAPVAVKAFANYYARHWSKLCKTQYLYIGSNDPTQYQYAVASQNPYAIPPFAKSVRVVRIPQSASITLELIDSIPAGSAAPRQGSQSFTDTIVVPGGQLCPEIPIEGQAGFVQFFSTTGNDKFGGVKLVYEIGF